MKYFVKRLGQKEATEVTREEYLRLGKNQIFAWNPDGTYNPLKTEDILLTAKKHCPLAGPSMTFWAIDDGDVYQ